MFSVLVSACAERPPPTPSIIDHGDGTYSLSAPEDHDSSTTIREGALTWSYVGQARHSWNPQPPTSHSYVTKPAVATTDEQRILGTVREDEDGSRWMATAVDMPMVRDLVARRDAESIEVARGLTIHDPNRHVTAVAPAGQRVTIEPHSWVFDDCDNSGGLFATDGDNHYWETTDDRVAISATTTRRKAMVQIGHVVPAVNCPYNGDYAACMLDLHDMNYCKTFVLNCQNHAAYTSGVCSGVILRSQWVLTAAHCVHDDNMNAYSNTSIKVLRADGVGTWLPITSKFIDAGYNAVWDPSDDWVLLKLSSTLVAPYFDMDISGASDDTLADLDTVFNYAFPAHAPNCSATSGMFMANNGELGSIYSDRVNFKIDGGPGHSGSPVFYCPNGNNNGTCEDDETGFVISVWTGWNGFETTMVGAKGAEQRTGAIAIMDSN